MPTSRNTCCVVRCSNTYINSPGTWFYRFPTRDYERSRRERWIALVRRQNRDGSNWTPGPYTRICSWHFLGNAKSNEEAHPVYNPSIFSGCYRFTQASRSCDRYARYQQWQTPLMRSTAQILLLCRKLRMDMHHHSSSTEQFTPLACAAHRVPPCCTRAESQCVSSRYSQDMNLFKTKRMQMVPILGVIRLGISQEHMVVFGH